MSHITTVNIELRDLGALSLAVVAMGGKMRIGSYHTLFGDDVVEGNGFTLPGWRWPLVLKADSTLAFDNYNGAWGNKADLATLKGHYAMAIGAAFAEQQGWLVERNSDHLLMHLPNNGGSIRLDASGTVQCDGFTGTGCDVTASLEQAIGVTLARSNKAEYWAENVSLVQY